MDGPGWLCRLYHSGALMTIERDDGCCDVSPAVFKLSAAPLLDQPT